MITFDTLPLTTKPDRDRACTICKIELVLETSEVKVDDREKSERMMERIKRDLQYALWHDVYGELTQPIAELVMIAERLSTYSQSHEMHTRVNQLSEQLATLLTKPQATKP